MSTLSQSLYTYLKIKKAPHSRTFKLRQCPEIVTVVWRIFFESPKKPNSGKRRVAKLKIRHVKRKDRLTARLPGYYGFPRKFFRILVRGGRANDTPGVTYTGIRGAFDFKPHIGRRYRRSFYGLKRPAYRLITIPKYVRRQGIKTIDEILSMRTKLI